MSVYEKLFKGLQDIGDAIQEIGANPEPKQVDLIVVEIVDILNLGNPELGDKLAMLKFIVDNEDWDLSKLTKRMMSAPNDTVPEAKVE